MLPVFLEDFPVPVYVVAYPVAIPVPAQLIIGVEDMHALRMELNLHKGTVYVGVHQSTVHLSRLRELILSKNHPNACTPAPSKPVVAAARKTNSLELKRQKAQHNLPDSLEPLELQQCEKQESPERGSTFFTFGSPFALSHSTSVLSSDSNSPASSCVEDLEDVFSLMDPPFPWPEPSSPIDILPITAEDLSPSPPQHSTSFVAPGQEGLTQIEQELLAFRPDEPFPLADFAFDDQGFQRKRALHSSCIDDVHDRGMRKMNLQEW